MAQKNRNGDIKIQPGVFTIIGIIMIFISFPLMWTGLPFAFCVTGLTWGSILISLDLYLSYRLAAKMVNLVNQQVNSERDQAIWNIKKDMLHQLTEKGLPPGLTLVDLEEFFNRTILNDSETLELKSLREQEFKKIKAEEKGKG